MCPSAAGYFKITNRTLHTLKKPRHFKTAIAPEQKFLPAVPGIELQKTDLELLFQMLLVTAMFI